MFLKRVLFAALCCLLVFWHSRAAAQGTSNKGTDFWVAYTGHQDGTSSKLTLFITSTFNAIVTIDVGGTVLAPIPISANQAVPVYINPLTYPNVYISGSDAAPAKKAIHVTSTQPIVVYSHISFSARSAATLVLPTKALGNEYYAIAYTQIATTNANMPRYSQFTLVGVEDATVVEITPTVNSLNSTKPANNPYQITLNKGDVYQFQSTSDVTGSKIKTIGTCKPVAVFSGSTFTAFCEPGNNINAGSGDNLYQQLFPLSAWGKNFVTAPFYNAQIGSSDIIRIQVSANNTMVKVNGVSAIHQKGAIITFASKLPNRIEADQPIAVSQFQVTVGCSPSTQIGDPEMTILNPIEQTLTDVTLYSAVNIPILAPTNITTHYLNIILKTADKSSLKVDGITPSGTYVAIDNEYSYITIDVTSTSTPSNATHRITANNGFTAIAYGYGQTESYAYLAGADLKNLNANVQIYAPGTATATTSLCSGQGYQIKLQLPYQTSKIVWELKKGSSVIKTETISPPAPDSTSVVNGQPAYFYKYANILATDISNAGLYDLKATVTNPAPTSCSAEEDIATSFDVYAVPTASFTTSVTQTCIASPVTLTNTSTDNGNAIVKWLWDYGDGTTEVRTTGTAFTHAYAQSGDYTVKLIVESTTGCQSAVAQASIHIYKTPQAKFAPASVTCQDQAIAFSDQSVANEGTIAKWNWDFGDAQATVANPNTATAQSPSHTFTKSGKYTVKLFVETDKGCISPVYQQDITIHDLPVTDFEMPDFCLSDGAAPFTNKTTIADGTAAQITYLWDFGDAFANTQRPNTSTLANPSHAYTVVGHYTVTLTATSVNGCTTTTSKQFTVNGSTPKAEFNVLNATSLCSDQPVKFEDKATVDFGEITRIDWYYDYGNAPTVKETDDLPALRAASGRVYSHLYPAFSSPNSKTIQVRMVAFSGSGSTTSCVADKIQTITLKAVPAVAFDLPDVCLTDGVAQFTDKSSIASGGEPFTYMWDFGDRNANAQRPNTSTDKDPSHTYAASGTYNVSLTVTAANGCSVTLMKPFSISASIPKPDFNVLNANQLCSDQPVVFEDKATIAFGEITKIEWFFDDLNQPTNPQYKLTDNTPNLRTGNVKQYSFLYPVFHSPMAQTVQVRMRAYSGTICVADIVKPVTLKAVPLVVFNTLTNICLEKEAVQFTQASETTSFPGNGVYSGNGVNASGLFDPAIAGVGTHTITYTFTGSDGCLNQKSQDITVYPTPTADAGKDQIILLGGQAQLSATAKGSNVTYKWSPATGLSKDDIANPIAVPEQDITYTLTVTSDQGCSQTDQIFIKVLYAPEVPNTFTPNGDGVNDVWTIKYLESYPGATVDIFNRYGAKVYSNYNGYTQPWDGKQNGEYLPEGTYYYIINPKNGRKIISGQVTIIK